MSLYGLARPFLFSLDPETAHRLTLSLLEKAFFLGNKVPARPVRAMGLDFPNPVGLAAGLDKNAEHVDALARLGFGFIEVGTVTPRPQPGNPPPRLFRLVEREALINRLGFNNLGVDALLRNLERTRWRGILGVNIGKNADTPVERAVDDYLLCLGKVYARASYVTINVSSPNTKNLRDLQAGPHLDQLLARLCAERERLAGRAGRRVPLALKIAPDLDAQGIRAIADAVVRHGIDGVIATNTSVSREEVKGVRHAEEAGGLSGAPIERRSTQVLQQMHADLQGKAALIGVGGILGRRDAEAKFAAGAALVQLYTGLVYRGPGLVAECVPSR